MVTVRDPLYQSTFIRRSLYTALFVGPSGSSATRFEPAKLFYTKQQITRYCFDHNDPVQLTDTRNTVDLVQELYLKEIRSYKAPALKASDAEGHVQKFSAPKTPQSPDEGDIAQDLKDYENQQVELEGQSATGDAGAHEESWFEEEDDEDAPAAH